MNHVMYESYRKRRSFHKFPNCEKRISREDLAYLEEIFQSFTPWKKEWRYLWKIKDAGDQKNPINAEYYISFYASSDPGCIEQIGYLMEEAELLLIPRNIGVLFYGMGKEEVKQEDNLDFVIMMAIGKVDSSAFRYDQSSIKRKKLHEIYEGNRYLSVAQEVRYAPSAMNSQPWKIVEDGDVWKIYRVSRFGYLKAFTGNLIKMNRVDMGIFLKDVEVVLEEKGYEYERRFRFINEGVRELVAEYTISKEVE